MKLAYRDRILLMILVIVVTGFLAYIFAIKPKVEDIKESDTKRISAQDELDKIDNDIRRIKSVESQITIFSEQCLLASNSFLKHTPNFQADRFVQELLNKNELQFTKLKIDGPEVIDLVGYSFSPKILLYPLGGEYNVSDPFGINKQNSGVAVGQTALPAVNIELNIYGSNAKIESFFNDLCAKDQMSVVITDYNEQKVDEATAEATVKMTIYFLQPVEIKAEK